MQQGAGAQEENLHRRSDACRYLRDQRERLYPISTGTCLLSKEVTVFRGAEFEGYRFIQPFKIDVITCAAQARPIKSGLHAETTGHWGLGM